VSIDEDGFVEFLKIEEKPMGKGCYKVWKHYYSLKVSPDVNKLIVVLVQPLQAPYCLLCLPLVQYRVHHYSSPLSKLHSGLHSFLETCLTVKVASDE